MLPPKMLRYSTGVAISTTWAIVSALPANSQSTDTSACYFVTESGEVINLESWCGGHSDSTDLTNSDSGETVQSESEPSSTSANEDAELGRHFSRYGNVTDAEGNTQRVRNLTVTESEDGGLTIEYQTPVSLEDVFDNNDLTDSPDGNDETSSR